jgi:hypothetical protein
MEPHSYIRHMSTIGPQGIQAFITKWEVSGAAERANAQLFIAELCDVIGVEPPTPDATSLTSTSAGTSFSKQNRA